MAYLIPLDHTCLLRLVSTRISGVPIIFSANFLISLMALGARLLKPLLWKKRGLGLLDVRDHSATIYTC